MGALRRLWRRQRLERATVNYRREEDGASAIGFSQAPGLGAALPSPSQVIPYLERWNRDVVERYGRKRGWYRHHASSLILRLGGFRALQAIDWSRVQRLVFVCKGNICRSPYAEARARQLGVSAISLGLEAERDDPSDPVARSVAAEFGLDLSGHRARRLEDASLGPRDVLLGMESWHARRLREISKRSGAQISLLGFWCPVPHPHLEDPYRRDPAYFRTCFGLIDAAIRGVVGQMVSANERARHAR